MRFEIACPKSWVHPPLKNRGPKTTFFRQFRNLAATLTAYIFRMKIALTISVEKSGRHSPNNWGSKNFHICRVFRRLRLRLGLTANIFWTKHDVGLHNRTRTLEIQGIPYIASKFREALPTNSLTLELSFYRPSIFCFVPIVHRTHSKWH